MPALFLCSFSEHPLLGVVTLTAMDTELSPIYNKSPILFCLSWKSFKGGKKPNVSAQTAACISSCIIEEIILQTCSPWLEYVGLVHCFLRQILCKMLLRTSISHDFLSSPLVFLATVKYFHASCKGSHTSLPEPELPLRPNALRGRGLGWGDKLCDREVKYLLKLTHRTPSRTGTSSNPNSRGSALNATTASSQPPRAICLCPASPFRVDSHLFYCQMWARVSTY